MKTHHTAMKFRSLAAVTVLVLTASACTQTGGSALDSGAGPAGATGFDFPSKVAMESTRRAEFFLPSFDKFAGSDLVSQIVTGRVTATEVEVVEPGTEVYTYTTILVEGGPLKGQSVVTRSTGGVVTVGEVAGVFAGHVSQEEIAANADRAIDFAMEGETRPAVGSSVVALLAGQPTDPGGYFTTAMLVRGADQRYTWPAGVPNASWVKELRGSDVADLMKAG